MAGTEIANAYIALQVKMPGVKNDINKALGASGVQSVADKSGKSIGDRLASSAGKALKVGAVALGGILAAGIGTALIKGFQRLDAIDTARAKLTGLGNDAKTVDTIMANALTSVKGTAFGLGDAATVAAQAVAAGIKPGKDLEQVLGTVANTAAAAGTDLGEMGSIFSKAMTQANGVQNDVIGQLADKGIPIYQELGKVLGVTAGEVFNLASSGKINFDQFAAAATAASGTVAAEMGGTWSGAFDNFMASLGRVGEGLLSGLFPQLKDGLQDVTAYLAPFEEGAKEVGAAVGAFVADAGPKLVTTLQDMWKAGTAVVQWLKDNSTWLGALIVSVGTAVGVFSAWRAVVSTVAAVQMGYAAASYGATAATYASGIAAKIGAAAYAIQNSSLVTLIASLRANEALSLRTKIAIVASTVATNAATLAQKAFNLVLRANPIGLIVTAIAALVAGLVYFFTQTELGKAIWQEFSRFLGEAWANISGFFTAAWENVIQPVFQAIGEIATWLYETILKPVFDGIAAVVQFLGAAFKLQFDLIVNAFRLVGAIANWLWVNALQPAFAGIGAVVTWLWTTILQPYFNAWGALFQWLWANVLSPIFGFIGAAVQVLGDAFNWLWVNVITPVWDGIAATISTVWNWINTNVFTPFKTGIGLIGTAFENIAKAIGTAWDGIKKAAAVPINFVLDTVWNNGLRSFWNDMVGTLGLDDMKLPKAALVKFADGGVMPGYTPGRDVHMFTSPTGGRLALSGGEAIMRPEFTKAVGGAAGVARLNSMARSGQAFADGGVFGNVGSFAGDVWDNIAGAASVAWEFLSDPAAAIKKHVVEGIINPLLGGVGDGVIGKTVGALPGMLMKNMTGLLEAAAPKGVGTAGMGWEAMWQIVQNAIPGVAKTSDYRPGARTVNGGKSYHGSGRAIDLVPASMATFNAVAKLFPNASELIYSPAGNRQLQNGKPFNGWSDAVRRQHFNHVHLAMANGGVVPKLYDQGGWLPDGGMAINKTGKPEAVLTPAQSEALVNGGFPRELVIVDADRQLIGRMQVEADGRIQQFDSSEDRVTRRRLRV